MKDFEQFLARREAKQEATGRKARRAQIDTHRERMGQVGLPQEPTVIVPMRTTKRRVPYEVLPIAAALGILAGACGPQSAEPTPHVVGTQVVAAEPGAMATGAARETATAQAQPTVTPTTESPKPTATEASRSEIPSVLDIPAQLDSLVSTIKAMPKPLDPKLNQEGFEGKKRDVEAAARRAKGSLVKGDIEDARKELSGFKAAVREVGDPPKGNFIPKEIRDEYDPQGLVLRATDRVDPAIMDWYLAVVKMQLALADK